MFFSHPLVCPAQKQVSQHTPMPNHNIVNFESLLYVLCYLTGFGCDVVQWSLCHTCVNISQMDNVEKKPEPKPKHRAKRVSSAIFICFIPISTWMAVVLWQWMMKGKEEYMYISIWWMWIVNQMNDEQKPYLSLLFISSRPTDVCVIYSVLCADIGIICTENEKNG